MHHMSQKEHIKIKIHAYNVFLPLYFASTTRFARTRAAFGLPIDCRRHLNDILRHLAVSTCNLCTF